MRSRDKLLKITDLYQQNQDYRLQRLRKITLGLQAKRTRLQPRCGPLDYFSSTSQSFLNYFSVTSRLFPSYSSSCEDRLLTFRTTCLTWFAQQ